VATQGAVQQQDQEFKYGGCNCPLCGNENSVKGYKVGDSHGWWSYCFADHSFCTDFPEPFGTSGQLWFVWENPDSCLIEGPATGKIIRVEFK
jgi:hypothetical protein